MKKPLFNIVLLLACVVVFIAILAIVLLVAPGVNFFDVKYVRASDSKYEQSFKVNNIDSSTDIVINGKSVPIYVNFVQSEIVNVRLKQNFTGFTRSKIDASELYVVSEDNVINITTNEFEKFLFGSDMNVDFGLYVDVPVYYHGNINITANQSKVTFGGLVGVVADVTISTKGDLGFGKDITIDNLTLNTTKKSFEIGSNVSVLGNIAITNESGSVTVSNANGGNFSFTSKTGKLHFAGCEKDFAANVTHGSISIAGESAIVKGKANIVCGGDVTLSAIYGETNISTNSGDVSLGKVEEVFSSSKVNIVTKSGNINLIGNYDGELLTVATTSGKFNANIVSNSVISSSRGSINANAVNNIEIVGGSGKVFILKVNGNAKITTKSGSVTLSADNGGIVNSAEVTTKNGAITIYNPSAGNFKLKSTSGKIYFYGIKGVASNLDIDSTRSVVTATNISGKTTIKTSKRVDMSVAEINGAISVSGRNGRVNITLLNGINPYYNLNCIKKNIVAAPGLTTVNNEFYNTQEGKENQTITVSTRWGEISVVAA